MTIHKLTSAGGRKTACNLNVPEIAPLLASSVVWNDGGGIISGMGCVTCFPLEREPPAQRAPLKRYAVFSVRKTKAGTIWVRAGAAVENRDGSVNVHLDVLPIDGQLSLRDATTPPPGEREGED